MPANGQVYISVMRGFGAIRCPHTLKFLREKSSILDILPGFSLCNAVVRSFKFSRVYIFNKFNQTGEIGVWIIELR